jgi:hypothetical protein
MEEKLAWMRRSADRIMKAGKNDDEVQDNFLSFVHASHLLWFYFGQWAADVRAGSSAKTLVQNFVSTLEDRSAEVWRCLDALRTEDVHTRPVQVADQGPKFLLAAPGKALLAAPGRLLLAQQYRYVVSWGSKEYYVNELCERGLSVKEQFKDRFDTL